MRVVNTRIPLRRSQAADGLVEAIEVEDEEGVVASAGSARGLSGFDSAAAGERGARGTVVQGPNGTTVALGGDRERLSDRELLTKKVTIVPVEVVVRNVVAGSLAKRLGLKEGDPIEPAIVEWYYKNDALHDGLGIVDARPGVAREFELRTKAGDGDHVGHAPRHPSHREQYRPHPGAGLGKW